MTLPIPALLLRSLCVLVLFALSCDENKVEAPQTFTVTFDTDGGSTVESLIVTKDEKASKPANPKKEGYAFGGWYTDEATTQAYDFTAPVTADIILYAKWAETFTVSFNTNGGSAVASLTVTKDGKVDPPDNPTKEGYAFEGWYTDEATTQEYDFTTATVTADITLYAKWAAGFLIPDVNFRTVLKERVSAAFEGEYMDTTHSSVLGLTSLSVAFKSIASLEGIEYFTALTQLRCSNNSLTALDVTQNTALTQLRCSYNSLTALDVTQNTALTSLDCRSNVLTTLDVTQNTALTELFCENNELTALDVTQNTALTELFCNTNSLAALNVTQNTALTRLSCENNELTALDVTQNTALTSLSCDDNPLAVLDVTQNTALTTLFCYNNLLTALDVTQNTALIDLYCFFNKLTTLDVSNNTALRSLSCGSNQLTELNLSNNTALRYLYCQGNLLTRLDLRGRKSIRSLSIDAGSTDDEGAATNPLTELYVHEDLQTHSEIKEAKTNRSTAITISTYDDANARVCADFNPTEGAAGTCKGTP